MNMKKFAELIVKLLLEALVPIIKGPPFSKELEHIIEQISKLDSKVDTLSTRQQIDELDSKVNALSTRQQIDELDSKVNALSTRQQIDELDSKVNALSTELRLLSRNASIGFAILSVLIAIAIALLLRG